MLPYPIGSGNEIGYRPGVTVGAAPHKGMPDGSSIRRGRRNMTRTRDTRIPASDTWSLVAPGKNPDPGHQYGEYQEVWGARVRVGRRTVDGRAAGDPSSWVTPDRGGWGNSALPHFA